MSLDYQNIITTTSVSILGGAYFLSLVAGTIYVLQKTYDDCVNSSIKSKEEKLEKIAKEHIKDYKERETLSDTDLATVIY